MPDNNNCFFRSVSLSPAFKFIGWLISYNNFHLFDLIVEICMFVCLFFLSFFRINDRIATPHIWTQVSYLVLSPFVYFSSSSNSFSPFILFILLFMSIWNAEWNVVVIYFYFYYGFFFCRRVSVSVVCNVAFWGPMIMIHAIFITVGSSWWQFYFVTRAFPLHLYSIQPQNDGFYFACESTFFSLLSFRFNQEIFSD